MDAEWFEISEKSATHINAAKIEGRRIVAVGTTAVRTLEASVVQPGIVQAASGDTRLFITPGFKFKVVDAILTNFHFPRTTLIMLVSAFAGRNRIRAAYQEAIKERYRFYSYGDVMFIEWDFVFTGRVKGYLNPGRESNGRGSRRTRPKDYAGVRWLTLFLF